MIRRNLLLLLALLCIASLCATASTSEQVAHSVTIYRDNYGVPHVFGPTDTSCAFGFIYAQAEDNFWQIEDSYLRALGRTYKGYGSKTLDDDELVRTLNIPHRANAEYIRPPPLTKTTLPPIPPHTHYFS